MARQMQVGTRIGGRWSGDGGPTRSVIGRRARLVALLLAGALVAAGCSGAGSSGGGTKLRYGYDLSAQFTNTFDVSKSTGDCDGIPLSFIYDTLVRYDPETGEVTPGIATEWTIEGDDEKTITMKLRDDVTFHDGTKLDAAAVKKGLLQNKKNPQLTGLSPITSIDVIDPTTIRLNLKNDQANALLYTIAGERGGMIMAPDSFATAGKHPVGSGPFRFVEFTPGQGITLEKNSDYWEQGVYDFDGIEFTQVGTGPPALTALKAGSVDLIRSEMESLAAIEADDSLGVVVQPSGAYLQLQMRQKYKDGRKSPFADERVRQAMRYAINAQEINEIVQRGKGEVASQPLPQDSPGYEPSIANAYPYDPERAKQLLAEAGYPDGFEFTMAIPGPGIKNMADQGQLIQDQLKQVGVTAKIKPILGQDISTQYYIQGGADAFAAARLASTNYPAAYNDQWGQYEFVAIWNGSEDPQITTLMNQALGSTDPAEVAELTKQAARYSSEHALEVPIAFMPQILAYDKSRVGGTVGGQHNICSPPDLSGLKMK